MSKEVQGKYLEELQSGDGFYDIESLKNVFSLAEYRPEDKKIYIFAHLDDDCPIRAELATKFPEVISAVNEGVKNFIPSFMNDTGAEIEFIGAKQYIADLLLNYKDTPVDRNTPRKFGFNALNYDLPMLNYVMESIEMEDGIKRHERMDAIKAGRFSLPDNSAIRGFSDTLIESSNLFEALGQNDSMRSRYYQLKNTHRFIDIQRLNETGRFISLKRLSGYTGNAILESDRLSGENAKIDNIQDLIDLLVYNVIDSVNTALLFMESEYSVPFKQRTQMMNRFTFEFNGKLMQDSTSAQFIEAVISPKKDRKADEMKIQDDDRIYLFYPTNCTNEYPELRRIQDDIDTDSFSDDFNELSDKKKIAAVHERLIEEMNVDPDKPRFQYNPKFNRIEEDILEHAKDEYDLPDMAYQLYDAMRYSYNRDDAKAKLLKSGFLKNKSDPLNAHVPVRDSNAYVTFSIGGVHGEYYERDDYLKALAEKQKENELVDEFNANLKALQDYYGDSTEGGTKYLLTKRDKTTLAQFEHLEHKDFVTGSYKNGVSSWKKPKKKSNYEKDGVKMHAKTVYATNVIHADIASQYPTYISSLGIFTVKVDGEKGYYDVYSELLKERLALKSSLPKDFTTWTEEDVMNDIVQQLNKLLLNSASGVIDAGYDTNIRVNNKAMTMRICGQLILAKLVYKLTDAGAQVISINTDGVYYVGLEESISNQIIDEWCEYFKMGAEPEEIDLFITKDSNNRLEIQNGEIKDAAGSTIRHYKGADLGKQPSKPTAVDNALVRYLIDEDEPLSHFDRDKVRNHFQKMIDIAKSNPEKYKRDAMKHFQWIMASNPSKNRFIAPLKKDTALTAVDGSVFRVYLIADSDVEMKLISIAKQNKTEDERAKTVAELKGFFKPENAGNNAKFIKINNVELDNDVLVDNRSVDDIDINILDKLDLEQYVDITEQVWKSWSDSHVVV